MVDNMKDVAFVGIVLALIAVVVTADVVLIVTTTNKQVAPCACGKCDGVSPCKCGCVETGDCKCKNCNEHTADPSWKAKK